MSNTTTIASNTIQIIPDGSTDWTMGTDTEFEHAWVSSIQFVPSAASDRLIIHENGIDGPCFFDSGLTASTAPVIEYTYGKVKLVIDASDCIFGTAANCKILINLV